MSSAHSLSAAHVEQGGRATTRREPETAGGVLWMVTSVSNKWYTYTWLVVWNIFLPFSWDFHHPNWRTPSFFRGVGIPPTSIVFRIAPNIFIYFLYPPYGIQDWVIFFWEQMSIWVLDTSSLMDPKAMASPRNIEKIKLECPGGLGLVRTWIRGNPKLELHHALLVLWRIKHPNIG